MILRWQKEILVPLETLEEDIENLKIHIEILSIVNNPEISHRENDR